MDISSATSRDEHIEPFSARYSTARIPYSTEALKCTVSLVPISCPMFQAGTDGIHFPCFLRQRNPWSSAIEACANTLEPSASRFRAHAHARAVGGEAMRAGVSAALRSDARQVPNCCTAKRCLPEPRLGAPPPRFPVVVIAIARPNEYAYILAQAIILYFIAMLFHTMLRFRPSSRNTT